MSFEKGREKTGGREKGTPNKTNMEVRDALERAKGNHEDVSLLDSVCNRAYNDGPLAIALLRKMYPDMKQVEVVRKYEGGYADMTPAETAAAMMKDTIGEKPVC